MQNNLDSRFPASELDSRSPASEEDKLRENDMILDRAILRQEG